MILLYIRKFILAKYVLIGALSVLNLCASTGLNSDYIYNYDSVRHKRKILKIIQDNYQQLIEGSDVCARSLLEKMSPGEGVKYIDKLKVKTMYDHHTMVGFVSYYKEDTHKGMIQMLAVDYFFRGRGYGKKLLLYALNDLFLEGVNYIGIWVSIDNEGAKDMYKKIGFVEKFIERDNLYLEYYPIEIVPK